MPYNRNLSLNEHLYMMDNFLEQKSKVCPCFCSLNETHTSLRELSLPFFIHFSLALYNADTALVA